MDDLDHGETIVGLKAGQQVFRRFTLERLIGRGGMAQVWRAKDDTLGTPVALKFLRQLVVTDRSALNELVKEVRRSRELTHPHIVRVNDFHHEGAIAGISMELVEGDTLANLRVDQPGEAFAPEQLAPWVAQLAAALDYAHTDVRIVHRDIKPSNLMVDARGRLKVADFGIARSLSDSLSRLSNTPSSGTLLYMSPQQLVGDDPTPADDLYALGATLYELLTGKPPFHTGDIAGQVKGKQPASVNDRRAAAGLVPVPAAWNDTILALLAKNPADRPASAGAVAERLGLATKSTKSAKTETAERGGPSRPEPVRRPDSTPTSKRPRYAGLAAAVVLFGGLGYYFGVHAPEQRRLELARLEAQRAEATRQAEAQRAEQQRLANTRGGLIIRTDPAGAEVSVGGVGIERSPATFKELRLGSYEVTIAKPGYEPQKLKLEVEENRFTEPPVPGLKPMVGSVALSSEPAGLDFELTSTRLTAGDLPAVRRTGKTPTTAGDLPVGVYQLTYRRAGGWADQGAKVEVKRGEVSRVSGDFPGGGLKLTSAPAGATWRIIETPEGVRLSQITGRTPYEFPDVPIGKYTVVLQRDGGWAEVTRTVQITKGASVTASAEFAAGALELTSTPAGAEIWQGERRLGVTPYALPEALPGRYDFELRLKGYQPSAVSKTVMAGQTARESITLERIRVPEAGQAWTIPELNLTMQPVAPGSFAMGTLSGGYDDEGPVTQVRITPPYWLGKTEVTQAQYETIMGANPSNFKGADRPVEQVSWEEAMAFCRKLTERERVAGRLPAGYAYTLPTEAQWEYACRAGTTGDYAGSPDAMAWYVSNSGGTTHPVAQKQANAWGLSDMHGNVWEWCLDWYGNYPGGSVTDPVGAPSGSLRVFRGGCWYFPADYCRSALRLRNDPGLRRFDLGFRLALSSIR